MPIRNTGRSLTAINGLRTLVTSPQFSMKRVLKHSVAKMLKVQLTENMDASRLPMKVLLAISLISAPAANDFVLPVHNSLVA